MKKDKYYHPKTKRASILKWRDSDKEFVGSDLKNKDILITKGENILEYRGEGSFFDIEEYSMQGMADLRSIKGVIRDEEKIAERIYSKSSKIK